MRCVLSQRSPRGNTPLTKRNKEKTLAVQLAACSAPWRWLRYTSLKRAIRSCAISRWVNFLDEPLAHVIEHRQPSFNLRHTRTAFEMRTFISSFCSCQYFELPHFT